MATTTATYYYCDPSTGDRESRLVTMLVGSQSGIYYDEYAAGCRVEKRRRKITMTLSSSAPVAIDVRFDYLQQIDYNDGSDDVEYRQNSEITIPAGQLSKYEYVDTEITTTCTSGTSPIPYEL